VITVDQTQLVLHTPSAWKNLSESKNVKNLHENIKNLKLDNFTNTTVTIYKSIVYSTSYI